MCFPYNPNVTFCRVILMQKQSKGALSLLMWYHR